MRDYSPMDKETSDENYIYMEIRSLYSQTISQLIIKHKIYCCLMLGDCL